MEERGLGRGLRRTPDKGSEDPLIPLPTPNHDSFELLKGALNDLVADERTIDGPEDLTGKTTAQTGLRCA